MPAFPPTSPSHLARAVVLGLGLVGLFRLARSLEQTDLREVHAGLVATSDERIQQALTRLTAPRKLRAAYALVEASPPPIPIELQTSVEGTQRPGSDWSEARAFAWACGLGSRLAPIAHHLRSPTEPRRPIFVVVRSADEIEHSPAARPVALATNAVANLLESYAFPAPIARVDVAEARAAIAAGVLVGPADPDDGRPRSPVLVLDPGLLDPSIRGDLEVLAENAGVRILIGGHRP